MSYITNGDVQLRLGATRYVQLADDAGTGSADESVVDEARLGAEGEVDSYLSQRFAVPIDLATHPAAAGVLKSVSLDLAEYRLFARRRDVPDDVMVRRGLAVDWLTRVSRGEAMIPSVTPIDANAATGVRARASGESRLLSRDELSDY
jgi:phage gp36-like protein